MNLTQVITNDLYIRTIKTQTMKKLSTLLILMLLVFAGKSQTTVYTTGQTYADNWTGWSNVVTTGTTFAGTSGPQLYSASGPAGAYTFEIKRQFTISSTDIDFYLAASSQNSTVSVLISTNDVTYTQIGSLAYGGVLAQSILVIPTVNPGSTTFWVKLRTVGTFPGGGGQTIYNNLKIDAVLSSTNSVSVSPMTTQNILVGANGTVLSKTEAPSAATSREWKYSTTSGSGYVSFSPVQTGATYTPNFATAGTYYVVCVSNFSGDMQTSNQVQINVTAPAALEDFTIGSNVRYANGMLDIVTPIQSYNVQIFDINGQLIISEQNMKSYDFAGNNHGIYFVSFYYNGERKTLKIAHVK